jgi:hypothetical protein
MVAGLTAWPQLSASTMRCTFTSPFGLTDTSATAAE